MKKFIDTGQFRTSSVGRQGRAGDVVLNGTISLNYIVDIGRLGAGTTVVLGALGGRRCLVFET